MSRTGCFVVSGRFELRYEVFMFVTRQIVSAADEPDLLWC